MNRRLIGAALAAAGLLAILLGLGRRARTEGGEDGGWIPAVEGAFELWTELEGELAARTVASVSSRVHGPATLVYLAPEGRGVRRGDVVARFDSFQLEQELERLDLEAAIAEAEWRMLELAALPLEDAEMETSLFEARAALQAEASFLADGAELMEEGLLSAQELDQHRMKVEGLRARVAQIEMRRRLAREHLHPTRLQEARAKLDAARRRRDSIREQLAHCTVEAPADGEIVYVELALGGERRAARVGDVLYRNQEFLCIPDPSEWVARCRIPEQDVSRVRAGMPARVAPLAFPGVELEGEVETVSAMGQMDSRLPGRRVFPATIRVAAVPEGMKSGLTVRLRLLSRREERALLVPRSSVRWEQGRPHAEVRAGPGRAERRDLVLGDGNARHFEVLSGLAPGDWIRP